MVSSRLVRILALLGLERDCAVLAVLYRDSLIVDEAGVLLRVLVRQVEGVSRELNSAGGLRLNEVGILVSWMASVGLSFYQSIIEHTNNLPKEVAGDVRSLRHLV